MCRLTSGGVVLSGFALPGKTTPPEVSLHIDHLTIWRYGP